MKDLPESPDAAYVGVNRYLTIDIVRDLAEQEAGGAVCYATGFIEAGEEGWELQERLLKASGIGRSIAEKFLSYGCTVHICDVDQVAIDEFLTKTGKKRFP